MALRQTYLEWAEVVNAWRLIPRLLLALFGVFTVYYVVWVTGWYMDLPPDERSLVNGGGFAAGTVTAVTGLFTTYAGIYTRWRPNSSERSTQ